MDQPSPPSEANADLDVEAKRTRILEAAFEVCQRRGVMAARMEEVAALAQVSKGTLYRFFSSKEDLFLATIIEFYEAGHRMVGRRVEAAKDPLDRLERALDGLVGVLAQVAPRNAVYNQAWGVVAHDPAYQERLLGFLRRFHAQRHVELTQLVRSGQARAQIRADIDPEVVAHSIGSLLSGFIYRATFDPQLASPDALRDCFDALVRGIRLPVSPGSLGEGG